MPASHETLLGNNSTKGMGLKEEEGPGPGNILGIELTTF